ncbi:hypothetical protein ABZS66_19000 [Dactylosporangium sp. NPDC005572]|uniref:hypothetical protein n=1 Tax=Dactylosporangium sp. NPDC005572 TaxID=3156889 RepID=UPI0033B32D92
MSSTGRPGGPIGDGNGTRPAYGLTCLLALVGLGILALACVGAIHVVSAVW